MIKKIGGYGFYFLCLTLTLGLPLDTPLKASIVLLSLGYSLLSPFSFSKKSIFYGGGIVSLVLLLKCILPITPIEEGGNIFVPQGAVFEKLPPPIFHYLTDEFTKLYPKHGLVPDNQLYSFTVEQCHHTSSLSRSKTEIDYTSLHEMRLGAMNKLEYNTYWDQRPERLDLPFFVRYKMPLSIAQHPDTKICFKGEIFYKKRDGTYPHLSSSSLKCFSPAELASESFDLYIVKVRPETPVALTITPPLLQTLYIYVETFLGLLGATLLTFVLFPPFAFRTELAKNSPSKQKLILLGTSIAVSVGVALLYRPLSRHGFILFEGGNDGLTYAGTARIVLEGLYKGDWYHFFQGGEDIYMLMPWHRYFYALNLWLFGETHFGYFIITCFFPWAIYRFVKEYFHSHNWAFWISFIFIALPIFESFGFAQFYMVRLCMRGFCEPLSYFFLLLGLSFLPQVICEKNPGKINFSIVFSASLLLCLSVGIRPNVLLAAGVFLAWVSLHFLKIRSFKALMALGTGFIPFLAIPLHNYYFGHAFVLITASADIPWNLVINPREYLSLIKDILTLSPPLDLIHRITVHLKNELPLTQPWLLIGVLVNIFLLVQKRVSLPTKFLGLAALAQFSLTFCYHVGGRYGYAHWILIILGTFLYIKENNFITLKRK